MNYFDITVSRGSGGFGLSLIYRGLDKFPAPETGIFVARVVPGGHSHRAGLQENDKIMKINRKDPRDVNDAVAIIKKAGKHLVVSVGRKQPDILNQGEQGGHLMPTIHVQPPLSRSGSARSLNTTFAQGASRPHTPFDSNTDEQRYAQKLQQQQQQKQQQQQYAQQQYEQQLAQQQYEEQQRQLQEQQRQQQDQQRQQQEQLEREQLDRERAAIAAENKRIHAQQLELQRQKDELNRAQQQQQQLQRQQQETARERNNQGQMVSDILSGGFNRTDFSHRRSLSRPRVYNSDDSSDEDDGVKFLRGRRSKSVDARRNRAKSPGSLSGISFHDLSELSTVSRMSRFEEKDNMQTNNNRLAGYIDKVRQLQTENTRMTKQVEYIEESQLKEMGNIKNLYDKEVNDLKNAIDSLAKSYRELQGNSDRILQTNRDLKTKVNRKSTDLKNNNDAVIVLKDQLSKLRTKMSATEKDKGKVTDRLNDVLPEVKKVQDKISETLYQLGDVKKVNRQLEEQTGCLSLELKSKMQKMDTTLAEVKVRKRWEVIEISGKLEKEYEFRVQKALAGLREVYENQVKESQNEFNQKCEAKVSALQSKLSKERFDNNSSGQGVEETNRRISALITKVNSLEEDRNRLTEKMSQLERRLRDQDTNQRKQLSGKDDEIHRLLSEISKNMEEYQSLLHVKTALDMEIAVYRKLVESEEDRLGIDVADTGSQSLGSSRGCSSPSSPVYRTTTYKSEQDNYSRKVTSNQTQL